MTYAPGSIVVGNGCSALPDLTGQFVLLFASDACTFEDQVLNAQNANADGAILVAYENENLYQVSKMPRCVALMRPDWR